MTIYSLKQLPPNAAIRVFVTCDRITPESAENGMPAESGWVDKVGSRDIFESRNDVSPVFEAYTDALKWLRPTIVFGGSAREAHQECLDELRETIESLGAYGTDDGTTLYGEDAHQDYETGEWFNYALHGKVKLYTVAEGWVERPLSLIGD